MNRLLFPIILTGLFSFLLAEDWDTLRLFSSSYRLGKVITTNGLKGETDDTTRIFFNDLDTGYVHLLTDTAQFSPPKFRAENLGRIGSGYRSIGSGDLDRNGKKDLILGKATPPYDIQRFYWSGTAWVREAILNFPEPIYDIAVGDCDNDGEEEVVLSCHNGLRVLRYTFGRWDTTTILRNTREIKGVVIGNFDPTRNGREVGVILFDGRVMRIHWGGASWDTLTIFSNPNLSLVAILCSEFDAASFGEEICVINNRIPSGLGTLIEIYYSAGWNSRVIFRPSTDLRYLDLASGDFYDGSFGKEIVVITEFGLDNHLRLVYGRGDNWQSSVIYSYSSPTPRDFSGVFSGEVNHHRSYNDEVLFTLGGFLNLLQQYRATPPVITNISYPLFPLPGEVLRVTAKVYTQFDSLHYISDTLYLSWDGRNFLAQIKDSLRLSDSLFFYSIPPGESGGRCFYYIKAKNRFGLFSQSPTRVLTLGTYRRIYDIQFTTDPSGISPETNKWVITSGVVSGVFGEDFFIEDRNSLGFRGIFVNSSLHPPAIGDSVKISGRVKEINNLTTIRMDSDSGSSLLILERGISLLPQIGYIYQIAESLEGVLLKIDSLHFKERGIFQPNESYWAYNQTENESILVRIDGRTNIPGMTIPETQFLITGNIAQSEAFFQIRPRTRNDFFIYPPGIADAKKEFLSKEEVPKLLFFDATGRKVRGERLSTGIYFFRIGEGYKIVVVQSGKVIPLFPKSQN